MKNFNLFFIPIVCVAAIGILIYIAQNGFSSRAIPRLNEFIASTTAQEASSTDTTQSDTASIPIATSSYSILPTPQGPLRILIAKTPATRQQGLSGRPSMDPDEGLLFIFPEIGSYGFWMKEMNFPIDVVWIDSSEKIAGISPDLSPDTYPNAFYPPKNIQFVLEINAGMAQKFGLATGTQLSF